jgi:hypothetical protein
MYRFLLPVLGHKTNKRTLFEMIEMIKIIEKNLKSEKRAFYALKF